MNAVRVRHMGMHVSQRLVPVAVAVRLPWRMRTFERPSAYVGCTLKAVVGTAKFRPVVRLQLAGTTRSPSLPTAAVGQTGDRAEGLLPGPRVDTKTARIPSRGWGNYACVRAINNAERSKHPRRPSVRHSRQQISAANPSSTLLVKDPG